MTRLFELAKSHYSLLLKQLYTAGIDAVSEKNWSTLKSTASLIEQPSFALLKVHQHIAQLKKQLPDKSAEFNAQPYREVIHWARLIQPNYRKRQAKYIECFNDPLWWHRCSEKIRTLPLEQQEHADKVLHDLQKSWFGQSAYAHYSTLDMIHVYKTLIPVFSEWLHYAKTEFKKRGHTLPARLKTFYQDYLAWFEQALLEEKALLRFCLQERLAVGIQKGYGAWDDVIETLRDDLKRIGILNQTPKERSWICGYLTPEAFVTITQIIEQEGSEAEKMALHQLAYYQPSFDNQTDTQHDQLPFSFSPSGNESMLIKLKFYRYLPGFLQWLFWDAKVEEEFFGHPNSPFLQAQEAAFLNNQIDLSTATLETLLLHPSWQQSSMCLKLIVDEIERVQQWLEHRLAFFFPHSVQQLQNYQQSLRQSAQGWLAQSVAHLKQVITTEKNAVLSENYQSILTSAFTQLKAFQDQGLGSPQIQEELSYLEQQYLSLSIDTTQKVVSEPTQPLSEVFKDTLLHAIALFERTQDHPNSDVQYLKSQLQGAASLDDKTWMYLCVSDYIKNAHDLPTPLKKSLQDILKRPEFSLDALIESTRQAVLSKPPVPDPVIISSTQAIASALNVTHSELEQDPWDYSPEKLLQHCEAIKQESSASGDSIAAWNQKIFQYAVRFLKQVYVLKSWEDFVLHREKIALVLATLAQISRTSLFSLHEELNKTVTAIPALNEERWHFFKVIHLDLQMNVLENLISKDDTMTFQQPVFYVAPKERGLLNPTPRSAFNSDNSPSFLPTHTS